MDSIAYTSSLHRILEAGTMAASADNTQPWSVETEGDSVIKIFLVPERDIAPYDSVPRASYMAIGAFVENAVLAAQKMGYEARVEVETPRQENKMLAAVLTLSASSQNTNADTEMLYDAIAKRATNRKPYKKRQLSHNQKDSLIRLVKGSDGRVVILDCPQPEVARTVSMTERIAFQNKDVHYNLFKLIRWTDEEVLFTRDGFSIKTFELPSLIQIAFRLFKYWELVRVLNIIGFAKSIPAQNALLYARSAAFIGIIANIRAKSAVDYIRMGMTMQRVWLAATALGLQVQPTSGLLFFKTSLDEKTEKSFSEGDRFIINRAYSKLKIIFGVENGERLVFIFRVGEGSLPTATTLRREVKDIHS